MAEGLAAKQGRGGGALAIVGVLCALVLAWAALLVGAWWASLGQGERDAVAAALRPRAGLLLLLGLALPLMLWAAVRPWLALWPRAARRLREEVAIATHSPHAAHRITPAGAPEMRALAAAIGALADAHARLQGSLEQRIAHTKAALGAETQRLAALMSQLTFGVLVCNRQGRILLYNGRAVELLDAGSPGAAADAHSHAGAGSDAGAARPDADDALAVGLGRPIEALIDARAIEHAWQQLERRGAARAQAASPAEAAPAAGAAGAPGVASFVAAAGAGVPQGRGGPRAERLLHVQMVPTFDAGGALGGAVLLVDDVTRSARDQGTREALLQHLTEGLRGALANLRTSLQALERYPAMAPERRQRLVAAAHEEAERLALQLDEAARGGAGERAVAAWALQPVPAVELGHALQRALREGRGIEGGIEGGNGGGIEGGNRGGKRGGKRGGIECGIEQPLGAEHWLRVDSLGLVGLLATCARRLVQELGGRDLAFGIEPTSLRLSLAWNGPPLPAGRLEAWEAKPLEPGGGPGVTTLREGLNRHGAELWAVAADATSPQRQRLCMQLGAMCRAEPAEALARRGGQRPIAYDFDLFHQAGQSAELDQQPLAALQFTVFDTETTGLRPSEGDEIIAIGAVRIVNGRLLERERFDRRVKPRRAVRASAEAVHGISTAALAGEPPLEQVLPAFARFCGDSVLVAHNAAFDMRFLELARERTGVRFDQPVLDTMLLSAAVQPGFDSHEHHLEQIARRLGVPVHGRHQALGDALTTGAVLLKLLPLLAGRGIRTLGEARRASQQVAWGQEKF